MSDLPFDIIKSIIDELASPDDRDLISIKACSLVCSDLWVICRKHIFARIILHPSHKNPSDSNQEWQEGRLSSFMRLLLSTAPERVADHVRDLVIGITANDFEDFEMLDLALQRITQLEALSLRGYRGFKWSDNPLRPALLHLSHLPTLTEFNLLEIDDFVVPDLSPCVNLTQIMLALLINPLELAAPSSELPTTQMKLRKFIAEGSSLTPIIEQMSNLRCADGNPFIDFAGSLTEVILSVVDDIHVLVSLLSKCKHIRSLRIAGINSETPISTLRGLSTALSPTIQTLRVLEVNISFEQKLDKTDPFCGVVDALESIRDAHNVIQEIRMTVSCNVFGSFLNVSRHLTWSRLDEAFGASQWPHLRQLSLTISTLPWIPADAQAKVEHLESLRRFPTTYFPRLSSQTSLVFDFSLQYTLEL